MNGYNNEIKNEFWERQMKLPVWAKDENVLESTSLASILGSFKKHRRLGGMRE